MDQLEGHIFFADPLLHRNPLLQKFDIYELPKSTYSIL